MESGKLNCFLLILEFAASYKYLPEHSYESLTLSL